MATQPMKIDLPSYDVVIAADNNLANFLTSLNNTKRDKKDLEKLLLKNRNEQRSIQLKIISKQNKMTQLAKELKTMEFSKTQLQRDFEKLSNEWANNSDQNTF